MRSLVWENARPSGQDNPFLRRTILTPACNDTFALSLSFVWIF